jgi:hypothetical protein
MGWGIWDMDPRLLFKRVSLSCELPVLCKASVSIIEETKWCVGIDDSSQRRSKKGVYLIAPTGKLAKSLNTFEPNAKCSEGKRVKTIKRSKMGLGYVFFWRNRDKVLVQGPVDGMRKGKC